MKGTPHSSKPELAELLRRAERVAADAARLTNESARLQAETQVTGQRSVPTDPLLIEVIAFDCCPKLPATTRHLGEALQAIGLSANVSYIDPDVLPEDDARRCWPSPTLLVNGRDLFGQPRPAATDEPPGCRAYPSDVPTKQQIAAGLKALLNAA